MTQDGKPRNFPVRWKGEDFARIQEAVALINERERTNHTPTDIIRIATLRFLDEVLAHQTA